MCLICVEYEAGRLTIQEAARNLSEMQEDLDQDHVSELKTRLTKDACDPKEGDSGIQMYDDLFTLHQVSLLDMALLYDILGFPQPGEGSEEQKEFTVGVLSDGIREAQAIYNMEAPPPPRFVYRENLTPKQRKSLERQIKLALDDYQYSMVTDFAVSFEEVRMFSAWDMEEERRALMKAREYLEVTQDVYEVIDRTLYRFQVRGPVDGYEVISNLKWRESGDD